MTEWIKHDGSKRPDLPEWALVKVKFSNGWSDEQLTVVPSWEYWDDTEDEDSGWINTGADDLYITHYRVINPE